MKNPEFKQNHSVKIADDAGQKGTAIVIALFVLALLSVFVAFAVSRTTAETVAVGNETSEARTQYAAQGSLETMTRNFNKVFERRLNPLPGDIDRVRNADVPGLSQTIDPDFDFGFAQEVDQTSQRDTITLPGGPFAGLVSIRDNWRLRTTTTNLRDGTQVQLTRNILNNRIPIFQFGIFYNDDLELFRPPRFMFGGRVHSNGNFFVSPGAEGIYFDSRVTAVGHIVTQSWRNWNQSDAANNQTWIKNASGTFVQLFPDRGSVLNTTEGAANNVFAFPPAAPTPVPTPNIDLPPSRLNPNWSTQSAVFDGNLRAQVPALNLPLNVGQGTDLVEMVKRGKEIAAMPDGGDLFMNNAGNLAPVTAAAGEVDNSILRSERFANKTGIRISLADSKAKLPGCASGVLNNPVATPCGVRLDGAADGQGNDAPGGQARGYQPKAMRLVAAGPFNYRATRINGDRLFNPSPGNVRGVWIKVETVQTDAVTGAILTTDITEDILSLGMTEQATRIMNGALTQFRITQAGYDDTPPDNSLATAVATGAQLASPGTDSRSVIKIQRFVMTGPTVGAAFATSFTTPITTNNPTGFANVVSRYGTVNNDAQTLAGCLATPGPPPTVACTTAGEDADPSIEQNRENLAHLKRATVNNVPTKAVVPFPIEMFDTREGTYFDNIANTPNPSVTRNGVMSMIDIDVANLRRFLRGDFNGLFPEGPLANPNSTPFSRNSGGNLGLRACTFLAPYVPANCDIPENAGWVLYISDRRGDGNFDGEYDMENIYREAANVFSEQPGEDLDGPTLGPVGFVPRFGAGVLDQKYIDPNNFANCVASPIAIPTNCEAPKWDDIWPADRSAVGDHPYFRRGVRLINGRTVPGIYNAAAAANTKGFTVASENGLYVQGNYNATGAAAPPALGNTPHNQYLPLDTPAHIPASIVADAVTILSNGWNDAQSFSSPYNQANRAAVATQMRFALITGDAISTRGNAGMVHQGTTVNGWKENGGVHNFKRFLEVWSGVRLDYSGSLINLFNSRNNNGSFKCCNTVYNPPIRNWVFDETFLNPDRIPPGTPYFQFVQTTGFERTNR